MYYDSNLTTPFQPVRSDRYYSIQGGSASIGISNINYAPNRGIGNWNSGSVPNVFSGANWENVNSKPSTQVRLNSNGKLIVDGLGIYKRYMQDITNSSNPYIIWAPRHALLSGNSY